MSGQLGPGGKLTTGSDATANDPVETSLTLRFGGNATIDEVFLTHPNPPGFSLFGQQVVLTAPMATSQEPHTIVFLLDVSIIPDGHDEDTVHVFSDGHVVRNCGPVGDKAAPDPCVSKRNLLAGPAAGDVQLTVLTSSPSTWNFGVATGPPPDGLLGDVNGDGSVDSLDAWWVLLLDAGLVGALPVPGAGDVNEDGATDSLDAMLILQYDAGLLPGLPPP